MPCRCACAHPAPAVPPDPQIKDAVDKRRNDEASLCSVSVACPLQNLLHADITYDYPVR
jgi:hypothetical protein